MGVDVHRHADIAVPHQVLERFRVHPGLGLVAAVGVAADMRGDVRHLHPEDLIVPVHHVVEPVFPVHRHQRHALVVQVEEADVSVDHLLDCRRLTVFEDGLKAAEDLLRHGDLPGACVRLCGLDDVLNRGSPLQLLVNVDDPVLHVQVADGQAAELRDTYPGMEQDEDCLIVFAVAVVIPDKLQELPHLIAGDGLPGDAVVYDHTGKLKGKGILVQTVVIHCHLEGRPEHSADRLHCAIPFT